MRPKEHQLIVVGGGLAGLCASIHLAKEGMKVALFEPKPYPRHKVCGEYISKEVLHLRKDNNNVLLPNMILHDL